MSKPKQLSKSEMKRTEVLKGNPLPDELTMLRIGNAHLVGELKAHMAESEKFVLEATTRITVLRRVLQEIVETYDADPEFVSARDLVDIAKSGLK